VSEESRYRGALADNIERRVSNAQLSTAPAVTATLASREHQELVSSPTDHVHEALGRRRTLHAPGNR
jgi:hypothetical protein